MIVGIGTDIVEIHRVAEAAEGSQHFLERLFSEKERAYIKLKQKSETIAGLFAAKEAVSKALGTGFRGFLPNDIEITVDELGKPQVTLYAGALKRSNLIKAKEIHLSISHSQTYATAFAVAEGGDE